MNNRSFTPTRFVFVLLLLGALYMVGKVVNPPPAAPPAPPAPPPTATPGPKPVQPVQASMQEKMRLQQKDMQARQRQTEERNAIVMKLNGGKPLPPDDGTTNEYFGHSSMGPQGISQTDKEAIHDKEINAKADEIMKQKEAHSPQKGAAPNPMVLPQPVPLPTATK